MWSVPPLWPGRTVAILASGPSMSQAVADAVRAAGIPAIAVNSTFSLAPWADMLYAADAEWWLHPDNRDALAFAGLRVTCRVPVNGVHCLRDSGADGFDPDPGYLRTGSNSGYQALHVAAHAGAARVLLCGFDMRRTKDGCHWHGAHPTPLRETTDETYAKWVRRFETIAGPLASRVVDVANVTPGSALTCFRVARLEEELASCPEHAAV